MKGLDGISDISKLKDKWNGKVFFGKYPELENGKDSSEGLSEFAEGGYGPEVIVAETMRGAPVAATTGATLAMPEQAPIEQLEYLKERFGVEMPEIFQYDNSDPSDYSQKLNNLEEGQLQVMHPMPNISDEVYANNPEILDLVNNKENLPQFAPNTPSQEMVDEGDVYDVQMPYVLKTGAGAAGDGVQIIQSEDDLPGIAEEYSGELIAQEYVDEDTNYGIQFFIEDEDNIHFVGHNKQSTTEDGAFLGVTCDLTRNPPQDLLEFGAATAQNVAETGYTGFAGFDVLQDGDELYAIDPNIRITASTPGFMLSDELRQEYGDFVTISGIELEADSFDDVVHQLEQNGGFPLCSSHNVDGSYEVFAVTGGETEEDANYRMEELRDALE